MFRRHSFVMAALFFVACTLNGANQSNCSGDEPPLGAPLPLQCLETDSAKCESAESKPLWPRTWEPRPGVTFRLRGRVDTDALWSSQSPANEATFGDLADVVGLRRARIGAEGGLGMDRRYVAEIDLATGLVVLRDVYVALGSRQETGEGQIGHFREPFSLEGGTSARHFAFSRALRLYQQISRIVGLLLSPGASFDRGDRRCLRWQNTVDFVVLDLSVRKGVVF